MGKDTRICKACGSEYDYCPKCQKYAHLPQWMWRCDTDECNDIFNALSAYNMGFGSIDEIKRVINKHNITDYSKFVSSIADKLNSLLPIEKAKKNKKKEIMDIDLITDDNTVEPVVDEPIIEPVVEDIVIEGISED